MVLYSGYWPDIGQLSRDVIGRVSVKELSRDVIGFEDS